MGAADLPCAGAKKHVRAFRRLGWSVARSTGSHIILTKAGVEANLSIPDHRGRDVSRMLLAALLRKAGITVEQYLQAFDG